MSDAKGAQLATGWLELVVSTQGAQKSMTSEMGFAGNKAGEASGRSLGGALLANVRRFAGPLAAIAAGFSARKIIKDSTEDFENLVQQTNQLQRIAGGTSQQVSGLMGALQLAGVSSDKYNGSLTIFAKNLGNAALSGAKTTAMNKALGFSFQDATGQIKPMSQILPGLADKFAAMPDGASKAALATSLFGRSGAALLPFLNKGSAGISDLTAQATKMGLVVGQVSQKVFADAKASTRGYQAAVQGLMVTLGGNLVPILDGVQNIYRNTFAPVITAFTGLLQRHRASFIDVGEAINKFSESIGGKVSAGLVSLFRGLGVAFKTLGPQVLQAYQALSPFQLIFKALVPVLPQIAKMIGLLAMNLGGVLGKALMTIVPAAVQLAGVLAGSLSKVLIGLVPVVVSLLKALMPLVPALMPLVNAVLSLIAPLIKLLEPILKPLVSIFAELLKPILALVSPLLNLLVPVLSVVANILAGWFGIMGKVIGAVVDLVSGSKKGPKEILEAFKPLTEFFLGLFNGIRGIFTGFTKGVVGFFTGLPKTIMNTLAGAGAWLVDIGKNMIQGLLNGAGSLLKNIGTFFLKIIPSWIVAPFKSALGIHSPSTVFAALGWNIVQGLVQGVDGGRQAVGASISSLVPVPAGAGYPASAAGSSFAGAGSLLPSTITLVDQDGSIIAKTKVVVNHAIAAADNASAAIVNGGINR